VSKINGYQCDMCGEYAAEEYIGRGKHRLEIIPNGWIIYYKRMPMLNARHMCPACATAMGL